MISTLYVNQELWFPGDQDPKNVHLSRHLCPGGKLELSGLLKGDIEQYTADTSPSGESQFDVY